MIDRHDPYLLIEFAEGFRELTWDEFCGRIDDLGRICARIHARGDNRPYDRDMFLERLRYLREQGAIGDSFLARLQDEYGKTCEGLDAHETRDLNDIAAENIMINESGRLLIVDEETVRYALKGLGLVRLLARLRTDSYWSSFLSGYNETQDSSYLTPAYLRHLQLVEFVRTIAMRIREGNGVQALWLLQRLHEVV